MNRTEYFIGMQANGILAALCHNSFFVVFMALSIINFVLWRVAIREENHGKKSCGEASQLG